MAVDFPTSPSNGQTFTSGTITYTYNSTASLWNSAASGGGGSSVTVSDTAPTSPSDGDMWYNSLDLNLYVYYNDGSSSQWVQSAPQQAGVTGAAGAAGSATSYANLAGFPSSGNTAGDMGFATDTKAVYIWDGTEWDRIYTDTNVVPDWTTAPPANAALAADGTATTQTVVATDPEGFPIEYSFDTNPANQAQATISQSNNVFTITPSTVAANAGDFTLRYKASDGLHSTSRSTAYTLGFYPQTSNIWGHWDIGNSSSYSGTGTTWTDLSGNNRTITVTNTPASNGYKASGNLGIPVWETGNNGSEFTLAIDATVKTLLFMFDPLVDADVDNFQQILMSNGTGEYSGYFDAGTSQQQPASIAAHTGLTAEWMINGNSNLNSGQMQVHLEQDKLNSFFLRNYNIARTWTIFKYPSAGYNDSLQLKAIVAWTVTLTDAELAMAHNSYLHAATWDG